MKRRRYMPSCARKEKVGESVTVWNGFWIARTAPRRRAEKSHGTLALSKNLPKINVRRKMSERKRNMLTMYNFSEKSNLNILRFSLRKKFKYVNP